VDPRTLVSSPDAIRKLPADVHGPVIESLAKSIHVTFLLAVPLLLVAFGVTWLLKETPLRSTAHLSVPLSSELGPEAAQAEAVGAGPNLLADVARDREAG
jgi:hypothetical protein